MDSSSSNLTSSRCDFVVATTEASINSGLREFLHEETQPATYLCFLANATTGNPEVQISLEDLLAKTGGVNPFDIPDGTPYSDPRITACTGAFFEVGIKMQMGIPPGVEPRDLSIITLGGYASSVKFNMYCSDITVIQNNPGGGEAHVLGAVFTQLQDLTNQFSKLSVTDILKKLMAILIDGILSSIQVVVDTILNVLHDLAQSAIDILDSKIHIPVISDILNFIGIPDLSFLDLFTWIGASAFTIIYKVVQGHAPFPSNDDSVKSIISAGSWGDMTELFGQQSTGSLLSSSTELSSSAMEHKGLIPLPDSAKMPIFAACHMSVAILGLVGNLVSALEAEDQSGSKTLSIPSAVLGITCAALVAAGDILVPMYPVKSLPFKIL